MKKNRLEKAFIGVFLTIVLLACASILIRFFAQEVLVGALQIDNGFTNAVLFDLKTDDAPADAVLENDQVDMLAPFYPEPGAPETVKQTGDANDSAVGAEEIIEAADESAKKSSGVLGTYLNKYKSAVQYFEKGLENWSTGNLAGYRTWVSAAASYNKILHWRVTPRDGYNSVIFLEDGQLTTFASRKDMTDKANSVLALKALADACDVRFLYVQYPYKIRESDPESGRLDFSNQNANQVIEQLRANGVQILDLRDAWNSYRNEDSAAYRRDVFYITDQHWRVETGLWAAGTIAKHINEQFGYQIDLGLFDPANYQYDTYPNRLLGSYGRQVTLALTKPEDFTLVYPKFETSFSFPLLHAVREEALTPEQHLQIEAIEAKERALNGSFSMFFDESMLEAGDYYNKVAYFTYVDNVHDLVYTHNNLNDGGTSVLFLTDSFGRTCAPFFALGVEDTKRIRPDAFSGSWRAYFEAERPDVVIYFMG